jgi:hypothetical protein
MNEKPRHKGNLQGWIAYGNTHYKPQMRTSASHLQAPPMRSTLKLEFGTPNAKTPLQSKHAANNRYYRSLNTTRYKMREQEGAD